MKATDRGFRCIYCGNVTARRICRRCLAKLLAEKYLRVKNALIEAARLRK
ncbi:MAG: hypothetical protein QXD44_00910 [Candidatus Nezhaarchaeales archaeon]